jgi:Domain of unknown function (DUF4157)
VGLLDRIRSGRQAGGDQPSPDRAATPAGSEPVESPPVITRRDLWPDLPGWQMIPPIEPVIEEPPWIVSQHFDDSLVARQAPPQFIGDLGHSVSDTAPSGVMEGVAVLAPELDQEPAPEAGHAGDSDDLPLAAPHTMAAEKPEPQVLEERRLWPEQRDYGAGGRLEPEPEPETEPQSAEPFEAAPEYRSEPAAADAAPAEPAPTSPARSEPEPATPASRVADLVGAAPAAPAVQRLAVAEIEPSPFVRAETPADMPLAQLPSAPLPPTPAPPFEPPSAAVPTAGLIGSRPPAPQPVVAREPEVATQEPPPDLPLAHPPSEPEPAQPADFQDDVQDQPIPTASEPEPFASPVASSGPAAPISPEAANVVPPPTEEVAPLLGQSTPVAAEPEPLTVAEPEADDLSATAEGPLPIAQRAADSSPTPGRPVSGPSSAPPSPRPRVGIGAPLADLPPTAVGWDITKLSRADQLKWSRDMARAQRAPLIPDLPTAAAPQMPLASERPPRTLEPPTRAEPVVVAGTSLPVVPLEDYAPAPFDPDLPPMGEDEAPVLGLAAPLRPVDSPGPAPEGRRPEGGAPAVQRAATTSSEGASTRAAVGRLHGVDLTNVPVHRSEQASAAATEMHARAFTSPSGIAIPPRAGPLDSGEGRALLAHELTHVAQRARLGGQVPDERSPAGQMLEAEARATELVYTSPVAVQSRRTNEAEAADDESAPLPLAPTTSGPDQEALAASILQRLSDLSGMPAGSEFPMVMTSPLVSGGDLSQIQRADNPPATSGATTGATTSTSTPSSTTPGDKKTEKDAGPFGKRPSDKELANLSYWLYPLISHKIKGELREGRERLGMITDHYRRW